MRRKLYWVFLITLIAMGCCLAMAIETMVEEKAEAAIPVTTLSTPEGNTTFIDGTTWCVAVAGVAQIDLQNGLDWACGKGKADCRPIQAGGRCFEPNTLLAHASFAFNIYYQQNGNSDIACNFGGTAILTKNNPSYDNCSYDKSGSMKSSAPQLSKYKPKVIWWKLTSLVMLLYMGCMNDREMFFSLKTYSL